MATFTIVYGTGEGQTAAIADRLVETLKTRGHEAVAFDVQGPLESMNLEASDAILVGASIHVGRHQPAIGAFVSDNRDVLAAKPTAFFQVSLSAASGGEAGREAAATYVESFLAETDWHPDRIAQFGGALRYSEYGFLKRLLMKQIAKRTIPDVPTDEDVEFTDWAAVEAFAADVAAFVEGRLGIPPSVEA